MWIEEGLKDRIEALVGSNVTLFVLYDDLVAVTTEEQAFRTYATPVVGWGMVVAILFVACVLLRQGSTHPALFLLLPMLFWGLIMARRQIAVARAAARFPNAVLARKAPHGEPGI